MGYCLAVLSLAKLGKRRYLPANRLPSAVLPHQKLYLISKPYGGKVDLQMTIAAAWDSLLSVVSLALLALLCNPQEGCATEMLVL